MFFLFLRWLLTTHCCPLKVGWLPNHQSPRVNQLHVSRLPGQGHGVIPSQSLTAWSWKMAPWQPGDSDLGNHHFSVPCFFLAECTVCFARQVIPICYFAITCISIQYSWLSNEVVDDSLILNHESYRWWWFMINDGHLWILIVIHDWWLWRLLMIVISYN